VKWDKRRYNRRTRIEIMFGRTKNSRRVVTRYDHCPKVFLSPTALAAQAARTFGSTQIVLTEAIRAPARMEVALNEACQQPSLRSPRFGEPRCRCPTGCRRSVRLRIRRRPAGRTGSPAWNRWRASSRTAQAKDP
jgi:hypothetical protein